MVNISEYKYLCELHAHTSTVSACSELAPDLLVALYKEKGFDLLVTTDHFYPGFTGKYRTADEAVRAYMQGYELARAAGEAQGLAVLLGAELRFCENSNDYLLYGADEELLCRAYHYMDKGVRAFYKDAKREDNILLQAHPFRNGMEPTPLGAVDGIEVFNLHPHHNSRVGIAAAFAREHGLIQTAGTDCHHLGHQGLGGTRLKSLPSTPKELARLLLSGEYIFDICGNIVLREGQY